jgi:hypothetical protein
MTSTTEFDYSTLQLCQVDIETMLDEDWTCPLCHRPADLSNPHYSIALHHNGELICSSCIQAQAPHWLFNLVDGLNQLDSAMFYAPDKVKYGVMATIHQVVFQWMGALLNEPEIDVTAS